MTRPRWLLGVALAIAVLFSLAGCSARLAFGTSDTPSIAAIAQPVPAVFTVAPQTAKGLATMYRARNFLVIPIADTATFHAAGAHCRAYESTYYGGAYAPARPAGFLVADKAHPLREPTWECLFPKLWPRQAYEEFAGGMSPPRRVLNYDPAAGTVTFGPQSTASL